MQVTSNFFILFVIISLIFYYIVSKRYQRVILLAVSYLFYIMVNPAATFFIIYSTVVTYVCGRLTENPGKKRKVILVCGLILDLGMLIFLKYTNFFIDNICYISGTHIRPLHLILPLGISYYTFSTVGYILDVYWGRTKAEHDFFKLALFVSFFPQILQGPIPRYERLVPQFEEEHTFSLHCMKNGLIRILWGLFKKVLIADWAVIFVEEIFSDMQGHSGLILIGMILYAIQLYADFSGGIDMMIGVSSLFGIGLDENFRQPYFARSLSDFWRRWHISLGSWMKDYVMYPLTLSRWMHQFGKKCKTIFGKKRGRLIPICLSNIIVFLLVGIWHGPAWRYVIWGLYNGIIIALSSFFADDFTKLKRKLHINDQAAWYIAFMMIRTFLLVIIGYLSDLISTGGELKTALQFAFTRFAPADLLTIPAGKLGASYTPYALLTLFICCLLLLTISILLEKGVKVRKAISGWPIAVEFIVCMVVFISIPLFGPLAIARGFIYAQF